MDQLILKGVSENNLKNLVVEIPHDRLVVLSGLSGSGKSTLAFDTIYAEGGRRYIETFSPYTRQFLDRLHPPAIESIEHVRPALALEQRNKVTSSRSTVGTVTEINDYLKIVWSHFSELLCEKCNTVIQREPVEHVVQTIIEEVQAQEVEQIFISFDVAFSKAASIDAFKASLLSAGHIRYLDEDNSVQRIEEIQSYPNTKQISVLVDRIRCNSGDLRSRLRSSVAQGYIFGRGELSVWFSNNSSSPNKFRNFCEDFRCSGCGIEYPGPRASFFSFNSPVGACTECNGFGKILKLDPELCILDRTKSIKEGVIHCWSTTATSHLKRRLLDFCEDTGIPTDVAWRKLSSEQQQSIFAGSKEHAYKGVTAWFRRLEKKRHKMHVRVLLSRYRSEQTCSVCSGSRLKPQALRYFISGKTLPDIWGTPLEQVIVLLESVAARAKGHSIVETAVGEVISRVRYLCDIGLSYLTLDRQSRTLSGGESQRVNLTSLLGSRLIHTMLVLDEPTIGLHPKDTSRLIEILIQLRNRGNSLLVVEHDQEMLRCADHIIDLGPKAGDLGGEIVAKGSLETILKSKDSLTANYLAAELRPTRLNPIPAPAKKHLVIKGAKAHNLKNLDVSIPLQRFSCITGASGSGKSTLLHTCLYKAYEQLERGLTPAELKKSDSVAVDSIKGLAALDSIVLIDQSPIGKSPRSNPATYTKAWDTIRETLAATPVATQLGLSKSAFSFNVEGGRCPACKGAGQTKVEMQFLADVYVGCEVCGGSRFQESILSVRFAGKNVVELLNTSISDTVELFQQHADAPAASKVKRALTPLISLGLGYLRLGHPLSALSGGEAQRVKLASYLADSTKQSCLFILDEPTTGLHPFNINDLLGTFDALIERGHSVVCIEHNLDVIATADWIIDLGPEGGDKGGEVLFEGPPSVLAAKHKNYPRSATANFLAEHALYANKSSHQGRKVNKSSTLEFSPATHTKLHPITVRGAREHNLQNIDVNIPQNQIVAITGVSGSGKSTLAFDILFAEGQRRYINCLSPYARQYIKQLAEAEVDHLAHLPPTIAISQKTAPSHGISTVATTTEIYQYLRLLFAKAGVQHCIKDNTAISSRSTSAIVDGLVEQYHGQRVHLLAPVVSGRKGYYNDLFNRALNAGISEAKIDGSMVSLSADLRLERHTLHYISLVVASITVNRNCQDLLAQAVEQCLILGNGVAELYVDDTYGDPRILSVDRVCPKCERGYRELDPQDFSFRSARGVCETCGGRGVVYESEESRLNHTCPDCNGARIAAIGRHVYFGGKTIYQLSQLSAPKLREFLETVSVPDHLRAVVDPISKELTTLLKTIEEIGLDYINLDRDASTISGGEAQRLRLAKTLGSPLTGVCYVLDEPSIGLHPQDHAQLLATLYKLKAQGNTVVVVEHDEDTIRIADHVIDIGPGGGRDGGNVVFEGTVDELERSTVSKTGIALRERGVAALLNTGLKQTKQWIKLEGANANNLKGISVSFPLEQFSVVCGVSGAGKSSLVHQCLVPAIVELMEGSQERAEYYDKHWNTFEGADSLDRYLEIDQSPVGKTSSSTPISYLGIFDRIRKIYASLPEAKARGWNASHFSYNTGKGRCPNCEGKGAVVIPMSFLPEARTPCEYCDSMRYNEETLEIEFQGVSIGELLHKTFAEAYELFINHKFIKRSLEYVLELGLGYLSLGQATHTLSGGEAQRIKIARELGAREASNTLYILDEPTIGLHMTDIERLRSVLQKLVDKGNTVIVIEHNLDIIRSADYLVEVGPGAGASGGNLLFQGTPAALVKSNRITPTSTFLKPAIVANEANR